MENNIHNVYILTPSELTVIAAGKGIDSMFSIQEEQMKIDENMVCQAMNHLYQQEFLLNSGQDEFVLNDDLEKMMTEISQAHTAILFRDFTQAEGLKIIYVGRGLTAIEQSKADVDSIRLYEIPEKELENFLEDDIQGKGRQYKQVLDEEELIDKALENSSILQYYDMNALSNIIVMLERMNLKKNKVDCRIFIKQGEGEKQILCYKPGEQRICSSKEDIFVDIVVEVIRGALYDIG